MQPDGSLDVVAIKATFWTFGGGAPIRSLGTAPRHRQKLFRVSYRHVTPVIQTTSTSQHPMPSSCILTSAICSSHRSHIIIAEPLLHQNNKTLPTRSFSIQPPTAEQSRTARQDA